jgi:anti-anti-sigma factor
VRNHEKGWARGTCMTTSTVITLSVVAGIAYLTIRGRLVLGEETVSVHEAILRIPPNFELLIVNVRDVEKIDAAGLSVLVFAYSTARSVGARFRLAAVPPRLVALLEITRLDTILSKPAIGIERAMYE